MSGGTKDKTQSWGHGMRRCPKVWCQNISGDKLNNSRGPVDEIEAKNSEGCPQSNSLATSGEQALMTWYLVIAVTEWEVVEKLGFHQNIWIPRCAPPSLNCQSDLAGWQLSRQSSSSMYKRLGPWRFWDLDRICQSSHHLFTVSRGRVWRDNSLPVHNTCHPGPYLSKSGDCSWH